MGVPERRIEREFQRKAKAAGFWTVKCELPGTHGMPDRLVILKGGKCCWIELKTLTGKVRANQTQRHNQLRDLGDKVAVCRTAESALEFCEQCSIGANGGN